MGLAYRFALAGHEILIGSRSASRAEAAAAEIVARAEGLRVQGGANEDVARDGDLIVLSVPYEAQAASVPALADVCASKVVVVTDVPLEFKNKRPIMLDVPEGSATEQAQTLLPRSRVAGAFQNLGAKKLWDSDSALDQDVLVCADNEEAKRVTMELAEEIRGVRAVDAGPLASARVVEAITVLLIGINMRYTSTTGVRIIGI
jgi:NADPH-dependent F420 reductase